MAIRSTSGKSSKGRPARTPSRNHQRSESQSIGGREFGQTIEPMQAQMASGNCGLAEDSGESPEEPQQTREAA